MTSDTRRLLR